MGRRFLPALRGAAPRALETSDRVSGGAESKVISVGYSSSVQLANGGHLGRAADGWDIDKVVTEGYERSVWVYRAVEAISGHASRLPFQVGKDIGGDDQEVLEDHPLYRVLNRRANPLEKGRHFRKRLSAQVLLSKRGAFVEVTKSRIGHITRLDLLPPDRVRPIADPKGDYLSHFEFVTHDGEVREIAPERIRWIREPHPLDPFSGVTPLEAAGLSVELDYLSRFYNTDFIKNDGRPGGVVAIDADGLSDQQLDRLTRQFSPGARRPGQVDVMGTGPGGAQFIDMAAKPRDMSYVEAAANSKLEILSAFGVPESVLGSAAERTYANAEQEKFNFWTETMVPHLDLIASAFEEDVPEGWEAYIDTTTVEVLELPRRQKRTEALEELDKGARSIDETRGVIGLDSIDSPHTRALWMNPAKAPIAARPEDAGPLGVAGDTGAQPGEDGAVPGGTAADAVLEAGGGVVGAAGTAADAVQEALGAGDPAGAGGTAADAVAQAQAAAGQGGNGDGGAAHAAVAAAITTKTAEDPAGVEYDGAEHLQRAELAIAATLDALLARQAGVITARLGSPKTRRGTRFWDAGPGDTRGGDAPLDADRVTDEARWDDETTDALSALVNDSAEAASADLLGVFAAAGLIAGVTQASQMAGEARAAAASASLTAVVGVVEAVRGWTRRIRDVIAAEADVAADVEGIVAAVRSEYDGHARAFAQSVAVSAAQTAVGGAQEAAAGGLAPMPGTGAGAIVKTWLTRADARVRDSHQAAAGQTVRVHDRFDVGDASLRYPGDPFGPPGECRGCRCRAVYRAAAGATYVSGAA